MEKAKVEHQNVLDGRFVKVTNEFREYLQAVKDRFDQFDLKNREEPKRIDFVKKGKEEIFKKLDGYFHASWEIVKDFDKDKYAIYQKYYQKVLLPIVMVPSEINTQIFSKPFGYSGDYVTMNYIYEYSGNKHFIGITSYGKLINNYTCNIPFSTSNIVRKEFFKNRISDLVNRNKEPKILSVGSGPARELLELFWEGKINNKIFFSCLDMEKRALDYVTQELGKIEEEKRMSSNITLYNNNIVDLIRNKELQCKIGTHELIYVSGVFDYLKEILASRLIKQLFKLLSKNGILILCNASKENSSHRAYYEFLGGWNMVYRKKEELLSWTRTFNDFAEIKLEQPSGALSYWFLSIKKL